ncbi:hypothetical protein D3C78_1371040 [compost metagenome]
MKTRTSLRLCAPILQAGVQLLNNAMQLRQLHTALMKQKKEASLTSTEESFIHISLLSHIGHCHLRFTAVFILYPKQEVHTAE